MINKNKEKIEKIENCIRQWYLHDGEELSLNGKRNVMIHKEQLQAIIKTSIEWCEDEIERWTPYVEFMDVSNEDNTKTSDIKLKLIQDGYDYLEQLQSHLKWLKEKRGQENENNKN